MPNENDSSEKKPNVARLTYRPNELAAAMGVHRDHVTNLIRRGELAAIQSGRAVLISAAEVERYLAKNTKAA
jgi:excisionase family DNA binding protein